MARSRLDSAWRRARLPLGYAAVAAAGLATALVALGREGDTSGAAVPQPAAAARPTACSPPPTGASPAVAAQVGMLFVRSAVLRKDPGCSFDLVTPGVRGSVSRREWAAGQLPFQRFTYGDPDRLTARIVPRVTLPRTFGSWLVLDDGDGKEHVFELILVRTGERWLVDYWAPVAGLGDSA